MDNSFKIMAFYEFAKIDDLSYMTERIKSYCKEENIRGTVIVAPEGINGTLAGFISSIDKFTEFINNLGFINLNRKYSLAKIMPFYRLKVKEKKEIITMLGLSIDPSNPRGKMVSPNEWNELIKQDDTIVIDVRNEYESDIGSFNNALKPNTESFLEFKDYIDEKLSDSKDKNIAMFCTGGIRCEKASYYMKSQGFENVFQLNGGILKYLEDVDKKNSFWEGECFVFDNRVSVTHELKRGTYELCRGCNNPISLQDKQTNKYEKDVSCPKCYEFLSQDKKNRSRERSKQIQLSEKHNRPYPYRDLTVDRYLQQ
ncbi:MAG: rhodanese-related sulfurtransferase [Dehalococcoidia bacterium]